MRAAHLSLILLLGLPGLLLALRQEAPVVRGDLPAGLSPRQVIDRLGQPSHVSREVIAYRGVEQWHYGPPLNLRLVFDCPRGEVPRFVSRHATRAP